MYWVGKAIKDSLFLQLYWHNTLQSLLYFIPTNIIVSKHHTEYSDHIVAVFCYVKILFIFSKIVLFYTIQYFVYIKKHCWTFLFDCKRKLKMNTNFKKSRIGRNSALFRTRNIIDKIRKCYETAFYQSYEITFLFLFLLSRGKIRAKTPVRKAL